MLHWSMLGAVAVGALLVVIGFAMALPLTVRTMKRINALGDSPFMLTVSSLQMQGERFTAIGGVARRLIDRAGTLLGKNAPTD